MSGNKAANLHVVPRCTLKERLSGRVSHGTKSGPMPYLSVTEEAQLSTHLLDAAKIGYGKTRRDVMCLVETYVRQKGVLKGSSITDGWWQKFMKRNPILRLCAGDSTKAVLTWTKLFMLTFAVCVLDHSKKILALEENRYNVVA